MIICVCKDVSERDIAEAVAEGCNSFAALQDELEVGRCCGTCECAAREAFSEKRAACQGRRQAAAAVSWQPVHATA